MVLMMFKGYNFSCSDNDDVVEEVMMVLMFKASVHLI